MREIKRKRGREREPPKPQNPKTPKPLIIFKFVKHWYNITMENSSYRSKSLVRTNRCNQYILTSKYESKFEPMKEIAKDTIYKLLIAIDKDLDGKISLEEFLSYIKQIDISSINDETGVKMFNEAIENRVGIPKSLKNNPMNLQELMLCCICLKQL